MDQPIMLINSIVTTSAGIKKEKNKENVVLRSGKIKLLNRIPYIKLIALLLLNLYIDIL